jgi:nitrogen fixation protein NifU and related proteins
MDSIYREEILEHYKDPQNFGKLQKFTHSSKLINPFCGDEIKIFVLIKNNKIEDVGFTGVGCAISIASTSILTEFVRGKSVTQLTSFKGSDMLELLKIEVSETRKKCALLGLSALKDCLK